MTQTKIKFFQVSTEFINKFGDTMLGTLDMNNAAGPAILNEAASGITPTIIPNKSALGAGLGARSANNISLITNSLERLLIDNVGDIIAQTTPSRGFRGSVSNSGSLLNEASSRINPTLVPDVGSQGGGIGALPNSGEVSIIENSIEVGRFDANATATETRFMLYDIDNATLERVSVGVADSGGVGFKVLRIPN